MATATEVDQTAKQLSPVEDSPYGVDRDSWCMGDACSQALHLSIVVFGATGDLAAKKTFPALAALHSRGFMPKGLKIVGYGRSKKSDEELRKKAGSNLDISDEEKEKFLDTITYCQGPYDEASGFANLQETLQGFETAASAKTVGRLFYLALPPQVYPDVLSNIKQHCSDFSSGDGDCKPETWLRVVIEKPFGHDLASSEELSDTVAGLFAEQQIYRIDHFLGKEVTQNMLVMRFGNLFLSSVWSRQHIDNIQIVMKEAFGTEGRGGYFDKFGIIRDVIQNHLLQSSRVQMLALLIMERPVSMHPDDIRDEKTKAIRSMRVLKAEDVVIGQYTAAGDKPGYTDDEGVPEDSNTPTYSVCRVHCDNARWEGVPMLIKAGKAMNETKMEVRVQFKSQPGFFGEAPEGFRNEFVMQLKPKDAMYMKMAMKKPGLDMQTMMSELNLTYKERFDAYIPEAYERLILDAIQGNQQHFVRRDELRASWAMFTPILHDIDAAKGPKMQRYEYGSRAVEAGEKLIKESGYVRSSNYNWKSSNGEREA